MKASDEELARQAAAGEMRAFDEIVRRYRDRLYNLAYRMTGDAELSDDLAQEAFIRAYTRLHLYDPSRPFHSWLFKILVNLTINEMQKQKVEQVSLWTEDEAEGEAEPVEIPNTAPSPEQVVEAKELQQAVQEAMSNLPPNYKAPLLMRYVEGMSYEEIAEAMELPLGTVKTYLFRGKEMLRRQLKEVWREFFT